MKDLTNIELDQLKRFYAKYVKQYKQTDDSELKEKSKSYVLKIQKEFQIRGLDKNGKVIIKPKKQVDLSQMKKTPNLEVLKKFVDQKMTDTNMIRSGRFTIPDDVKSSKEVGQKKPKIKRKK